MNRHLNVYEPYDRPPHHEDQLTRAAAIVMRAIPLARDALLARLDAPPSARLPAPEFDIQTGLVIELPEFEDDNEAPVIQHLISVFLSPDEGLDLTDSVVAEREDREQRLDGVLRFGRELVVIVESKIIGEAPTDQAERVKLRGVEVVSKRVASLGWHELFEDWWALLERGLLAPAERVLLEDLVTYTEEYFPNLLPFRTLALAGEHELRRQRRLMALLREVTQLDGVRGRSPNGAEIILESDPGTMSTQRIALLRQGDYLALLTWPAELKKQATALYGSRRAERLLKLVSAEPEKWSAVPNPHLAFIWATPDQALYTHCELDLVEYVRRWSREDFEQIRAHAPETVRDQLWPWLRNQGYASADDDQWLDAYLDQLGRRDAHLRPGIEARRRWPWAEPVALDDRGVLAGQIMDAVSQILTALEEPLPPGCLSEETPTT